VTGDFPVQSSVTALSPFSNQRGCPQCGARYEIRVYFDRDYAEARGATTSIACARAGTSGLSGAASIRSARRERRVPPFSA